MTQLRKNEFMTGLFIDLSRAFDTNLMKLLIDKLYKYGTRGIANGGLQKFF